MDGCPACSRPFNGLTDYPLVGIVSVVTPEVPPSLRSDWVYRGVLEKSSMMPPEVYEALANGTNRMVAGGYVWERVMEAGRQIFTKSEDLMPDATGIVNGEEARRYLDGLRASQGRDVKPAEILPKNTFHSLPLGWVVSMSEGHEKPPYRTAVVAAAKGGVSFHVAEITYQGKLNPSYAKA